jgi:hypothetical protein
MTKDVKMDSNSRLVNVKAVKMLTLTIVTNVRRTSVMNVVQSMEEPSNWFSTLLDNVYM